MWQRFVAAVIGFSFLFFAGCKKESSTGSIYGYLNLFDQYGSPITTGLSGATFTLNGKLTATTDSLGKYTFNNQSSGVFTLAAVKSGFGSINTSTFQFVGTGSLDHDVKLSAIPNFADSLTSITGDADTITLNGNFTVSDTRKRTVVIFVGNTSSTSSNPSTYLREYSVTASNNNLNAFTLNIPISDLSDLGFTVGQTVYFAVYGAATEFASSSEYEDVTNTGNTWYTAISTTVYNYNTVIQ